jgi:hypothetical protein
MQATGAGDVLQDQDRCAYKQHSKEEMVYSHVEVIGPIRPSEDEKNGREQQ